MAIVPPPPPPVLLRLLARLLLHGEDGPHVRADLEESYARDLEGGASRAASGRRYLGNLAGSAASLARRSLTEPITRGALLDAKLGLRMLGKQPVLTVVAMLALGLGIPSALAFQHTMDALISPLPVPEGERMLGVRHWDFDRGPIGSSVHEYEMWRAELSAFEGLGAYRSYSVNVHDGNPGLPPVRGSEMTASAFGLLRVSPILGRPFGPADQVRGAPDVVILGEDLWSARFAGDPDIVGRTVGIGRGQYTVVGVMPADFRFPNGDQVWFPLRVSPADHPFGEGPTLDVFGRLIDGVDPEDADLEMSVWTDRMAVERPEYERRFGQAVSMPHLLVGEQASFSQSPRMLVVQAMIFSVLLVVCGNVGLLVLARTATRGPEMTIRTALGASRARIVGQVFVETVVLVVLATGLGLVGAELVARWFTGLASNYELLPYWVDLTLGPAIVAKALGLGLASAVVAGVVPALRATGPRVQPNLQRAAANAALRFGWGSSLLIVAEVVLSVGFLAMASVMVRSTYQDFEGELGFEPARYVRGTVHVPEPLHSQGRLNEVDPTWESASASATGGDFAARITQTQREFVRRLSEDDEVRGASIMRHRFGSDPSLSRITLADPEGGEVVRRRVLNAEVGVDFFRAFRRPILEGRDFAGADLENDVRAAIVNESFVRDVLGGRHPIGSRFHETAFVRGRDPQRIDYEVVGVVGAFGMNPMNPSKDAGFYSPMDFGDTNRVRFLVEIDDPAGSIPRLRELLAGVDPEAIIFEPLPLEVVIETQVRVNRFASVGLFLLAGIAFLLSATGLYALMSFTVAQRTREIGVRTALGAMPMRIVSTIARRALLQLGLGLLLGIPWAWAMLSQVSNETELVDFSMPGTIAYTLLGAALVGALACVPPTLRGLRIQPNEALREG